MTRIIENIKLFVDKLKRKYKKKEPIEELQEKYGTEYSSVKKEEQKEHIEKQVVIKSVPLFTDDEEKNKEAIQNIIKALKIFQKNFEEDTIGYKLVKQALEKITNQIINKNICGQANKLVDKLKKILESTIIKCFDYPDKKVLVENCLCQCGLRKIVLQPGYHLLDEDYIYIDSIVFKAFIEKTMDRKKNDTIIETIQPAYIIDWEDEEEEEQTVIEGIFKVYKYQEM